MFMCVICLFLFRLSSITQRLSLLSLIHIQFSGCVNFHFFKYFYLHFNINHREQGQLNGGIIVKHPDKQKRIITGHQVMCIIYLYSAGFIRTVLIQISYFFFRFYDQQWLKKVHPLIKFHTKHLKGKVKMNEIFNYRLSII